MGDVSYWIILLTVNMVLIVVVFAIFLARCYKRCPSNAVLVVHGKLPQGQKVKCVHGGAVVVWPLLQACEYLSLEPIQVETSLKEALSADNVFVNVSGVFTVAVGTEEEVMQNTAIRLLGVGVEDVKKLVEGIIAAQLHQAIGNAHIEEIGREREGFLQRVKASLERELREIGLVLINSSIKTMGCQASTQG